MGIKKVADILNILLFITAFFTVALYKDRFALTCFLLSAFYLIIRSKEEEND